MTTLRELPDWVCPCGVTNSGARTSCRRCKEPVSRLVSIDGFVAFVGSGENSRGRFPKNISELNDDLHEFARKEARR